MDGKFLRKVTPWIPLAIAAAYFMYLVASWNSFMRFQKGIREEMTEKFDTWAAAHEPGSAESAD